MPDRPTWFDSSRWHLDINRYLAPFIPAPPRWLPRPVSRLLGYREKPAKFLGNVIVALWSLLGVFCGVALVGAVSKRIPSFRHHDAPVIIGSFGAAAVLQFCAIDSPLAQPRNSILGQIFASIIGVGICKLFALNKNAQSFPELAGALACAITTAVMVLTDTVHPPAGATSLIAVTSTPQLGWFLIPVVLLGTVLMLFAALLLNNIHRRYPFYWWTSQAMVSEESADPEKRAPGNIDTSNTISSGNNNGGSNGYVGVDDSPCLVIQGGKVSVPENVFLTTVEKELLERISNRI